MLLCLDIGNSQMHGGVFDGQELRMQFRKTTHPLGASDEFGVFFTAVLRENGIDPRGVHRVAICSVVPPALYPVRGAFLKYFHVEPFVLQAGVKTGLKVKYRNPHEVGADRIAGAIGTFAVGAVSDHLATTGHATPIGPVLLGTDLVAGLAIVMYLGAAVLHRRDRSTGLATD